jgi:hypothetical protein
LGIKKHSFVLICDLQGCGTALRNQQNTKSTILGFAVILKLTCAPPDRKALAGIKKALQRIKWLRRRAE